MLLQWSLKININDMKMVSGSILLRYATVRYPSTERSRYSNCTVNPFNIRQQWPVFKIYWGYALPTSPSSMLNSLLLSLPDAIINARDAMQNPGLTRIFYNPGQTRLTRRKCDPDDPADPGDPTRFQLWYTLSIQFSLTRPYLFISAQLVSYWSGTINVHMYHTRLGLK